MYFEAIVSRRSLSLDPVVDLRLVGVLVLTPRAAAGELFHDVHHVQRGALALGQLAAYSSARSACSEPSVAHTISLNI